MKPAYFAQNSQRNQFTIDPSLFTQHERMAAAVPDEAIPATEKMCGTGVEYIRPKAAGDSFISDNAPVKDDFILYVADPGDRLIAIHVLATALDRTPKTRDGPTYSTLSIADHLTINILCSLC